MPVIVIIIREVIIRQEDRFVRDVFYLHPVAEAQRAGTPYREICGHDLAYDNRARDREGTLPAIIALRTVGKAGTGIKALSKASVRIENQGNVGVSPAAARRADGSAVLIVKRYGLSGRERKIGVQTLGPILAGGKNQKLLPREDFGLRENPAARPLFIGNTPAGEVYRPAASVFKFYPVGKVPVRIPEHRPVFSHQLRYADNSGVRALFRWRRACRRSGFGGSGRVFRQKKIQNHKRGYCQKQNEHRSVFHDTFKKIAHNASCRQKFTILYCKMAFSVNAGAAYLFSPLIAKERWACYNTNRLKPEGG